MKTSEINPQRSEKYRAVERLSYVPKLIIISSVAAIASILALLMAFMALNDAKHAKIQIEYELAETRQELLILKNQMRLTDVYLQKNHVKMEHFGLEPTPLPER